MIPKTLHITSRTKSLAWEERRLFSRNQKILAGWKFKHWDDNENEALISKVIPEYRKKYLEIKQGVVKADIARCLYLFHEGGVYCDTDYKWIKPIAESYLKRSCVLPISRGDKLVSSDFRIGNAVMISAKGYRFWIDFVREIFESFDLSNIEESNIEKVTGPEGLTSFLVRRQLDYPDIYLPPRNEFHPPLRRGGFGARTLEESYGVHYCWGSWRGKSCSSKVKNFITRKLSPFM